ncbi:hypothetical protein D9M71_613220 [compost metagenome]
MVFRSLVRTIRITPLSILSMCSVIDSSPAIGPSGQRPIEIFLPCNAPQSDGMPPLLSNSRASFGRISSQGAILRRVRYKDLASGILSSSRINIRASSSTISRSSRSRFLSLGTSGSTISPSSDAWAIAHLPLSNRCFPTSLPAAFSSATRFPA